MIIARVWNTRRSTVDKPKQKRQINILLLNNMAPPPESEIRDGPGIVFAIWFGTHSKPTTSSPSRFGRPRSASGMCRSAWNSDLNRSTREKEEKKGSRGATANRWSRSPPPLRGGNTNTCHFFSGRGKCFRRRQRRPRQVHSTWPELWFSVVWGIAARHCGREREGGGLCALWLLFFWWLKNSWHLFAF